MKRLAWLSLVALTGCPLHLKATLLPPGSQGGSVPAEADKYDHEVLYDSDHWLFYAERDDQFSEKQVHVVSRVLTEKGRAIGAQKSNWHRKAQLLDIAGQVIQPDGTVNVLEKSQVFWTADADSDNGRATLAFQLPNVQVGSIVEYSYVIHWPFVLTEANRDLDEKVPLRHYEVEVTKSSRLDYVLRAYHTHKDFEVTDEAALRHVRWSFDGYLPPAEDDFVDFEGPRWLYRNTAIGWKKYYPIANDWAGVYQFHASALDDKDDWTKGFAAKLDVSGCTDARCKVQRAWAETHRLTDNEGTGKFWSTRPLTDVVASQLASSHEQVLLFRTLLTSAGIASDTVFVTRVLGRPFDKTFPNSLHDDVVAWVRPVEGLPNGMFVDASCEHCQPGILRDVVDGADGVRVWVVPRRGRDAELHGEVVKVTGDGRPRDEARRDSTVTVSDSGDLEVRQLLTSLGAVATELRRSARGVNDATLRVRAEELVTTLYPQGALTDFLAPRCDKAKAQCERMLQFKVVQGATRADNQLAVPLQMFSTSLARTFLAEHREEGIRVSGDNTLRETVVITLPRGWKAQELPKPFSLSAAGFTTRFEVAQSPGQLTLTRVFERKQGRWPASAYEDARSLVRAFVAVRQQAVVLARE